MNETFENIQKKYEALREKEERRKQLIMNYFNEYMNRDMTELEFKEYNELWENNIITTIKDFAILKGYKEPEIKKNE